MKSLFKLIAIFYSRHIWSFMNPLNITVEINANSVTRTCSEGEEANLFVPIIYDKFLPTL